MSSHAQGSGGAGGDDRKRRPDKMSISHILNREAKRSKMAIPSLLNTSTSSASRSSSGDKASASSSKRSGSRASREEQGVGAASQAGRSGAATYGSSHAGRSTRGAVVAWNDAEDEIEPAPAAAGASGGGGGGEATETFTTEGPYTRVKCETCGLWLARTRLQLHRSVCREYKCNEAGCDFRTMIRSRLWQHRDTVHTEADQQCSGCGKKFKTRSGLNRHRNQFCRAHR